MTSPAPLMEGESSTHCDCAHDSLHQQHPRAPYVAPQSRCISHVHSMKTNAIEKRKTRIVCISDTHNNTPKLPPGDVLIHAGDLTNQGSYDELERTVAWLEKAPFEVKIVVAGTPYSQGCGSVIANGGTGNHEITLDEKFYEEKGDRWKWPASQSPRGCLKLLRESSTITYLENEAAMVYLHKSTGPRTGFKVFGSPMTPGPGNWAFEYQEKDAEKSWSAVPDDADIVISHTPPKGLCDAATKDDRSGCAALLQRLAIVRPLLNVCGHIHEARGVERVVWSSACSDSPVESVERWQDPSYGTRKLSLLDLTTKSGHPLGNSVIGTRQIKTDLPRCGLGCQPCLSMPGEVFEPDEDNLKPTSLSLTEYALQENEAAGRIEDSGVGERKRGIVVSRAALQGDSGSRSRWSRHESCIETAVINAALLGPRMNGRTTGTNKPIVVDIDLPVWQVDDGDEDVR